jgi:hypothetical protein
MIALDPAKGLLPALGLTPLLTVSGPNYGYNISTDVLHSGTVGAARMAAMLGVPALAASGTFGSKTDRLEVGLGPRGQSRHWHLPSCVHALTETRPALQLAQLCSSPAVALRPPAPLPPAPALQNVVAATVELTEAALKALQHRPPSNWPRDYASAPPAGRRYAPGSSRFAAAEAWEQDAQQCSGLLLGAFAQGDVYLNLNVPPSWQPGGAYQSTGRQRAAALFGVPGRLLPSCDALRHLAPPPLPPLLLTQAWG